MSQKNQSMVKDLTGGNVTQLLLSFAFPLFVSNAIGQTELSQSRISIGLE